MCIMCKYWSGCFAVWLKLKWMMTGWLGCNTKHFFVFVFHFFANVVIGSKCFKIVCLSFQIVCLAEIILCHILKGYHAHRNSNHLRKKEINCRVPHQLKMLVQCVYRKSKYKEIKSLGWIREGVSMWNRCQSVEGWQSVKWLVSPTAVI